jgi:hypothetical protein
MPPVVALKPVQKALYMTRIDAPNGARKFETTCASCNLRELCLPGALCAEDLARAENLVYARRRVKRGEPLFKSGAEFGAIYAIRSGFFKMSVVDGEGRLFSRFQEDGLIEVEQKHVRILDIAGIERILSAK